MRFTSNFIAIKWVNFKNVSWQVLHAFDTHEIHGFAIAGEDWKFVWATAKIVGKNEVLLIHSDVKHLVAVRYAWAQSPVANLQDRNGLPVTPFRTDDWDRSPSN